LWNLFLFFPWLYISAKKGSSNQEMVCRPADPPAKQADSLGKK
jgi:hypothetical protein